MTTVNAVLASTRAELLRLRKWPALWVMTGAWLLLNVMFVYVFNYLSYTTGSTTPRGEGIPKQLLLAEMLPAAAPISAIQGLPMFGGAIMMILGALAIGSGYGWGTWKTVFTQGPSRLATTAGSLVALVLAIVAIVALTFVLDLGLSTLVAATESQTIVWPGLGDIAPALGGGVLIAAMWMIGGALIGTLAKGPALGVGLGLVWVLAVENLLRGVANLLDGLDVVTDHLPGTAAGSLAGGLGAGGGTDGTPGVFTTLDTASASWLLVAYVVAFAGIAALVVRRRDLA